MDNISIRELINFFPFFALTIVNTYWTWQNRKVQNDRDIIRNLEKAIAEKNEDLARKDEILTQMIRKKNIIKEQYNHLLNKNKVLEGKLHTYNKLHNQPQVDLE